MRKQQNTIVGEQWLDAVEAASNLNRSQYLIWLGQKLAPASPLYNMIFETRLRGPLDADALAGAWGIVVANNEALRAILEERDGVPRMLCPPRASTPLAHVAFDQEPDPGAAYEAWLADDKKSPFDPAQGLTKLVYTAMFAWLAHATGESRLVIGMPVHNRASRRQRSTVGLFMEIFPVAVTVDRDACLADLGRRVAAAMLATLARARAGISDSAMQRSFEVVINFLPMTMLRELG